MTESEALERTKIALDASRNTRQATTLLVYRSAQMRASAASTREASAEVMKTTRLRIAKCLPKKHETTAEAEDAA